MKKISLIAIACVLIILACKKEKLGESKVVKVPYFELIGPAAYSTIPGTGTYSDPGLNYYDESGNVNVLTTPTESNVDLTTNGFYSASYIKKTESNYSLKATRLILITPVPAAEDYSGVYTRTSNSQTVTITKVGAGLYKTDNVGGVANNPSHIYDIYFGKLDNTNALTVPTQVCPLDGTDMNCLNAQIDVIGADTIIQWVIDNPNYGTSVRKFVK